VKILSKTSWLPFAVPGSATFFPFLTAKKRNVPVAAPGVQAAQQKTAVLFRFSRLNPWMRRRRKRKHNKGLPKKFLDKE
jgi:hypothetical protein